MAKALNDLIIEVIIGRIWTSRALAILREQKPMEEQSQIGIPPPERIIPTPILPLEIIQDMDF
ncbi:hypothetical protein Glove_78g49 [Diversispora epigaea]|uniref:Uncharacterized protein n=1 Tax=Diversispora epigaea TaxID=1348612 RepID=A0A397JHQ0_9GLOM|nr:hypothetical protein Glove_78g49 [Diversispora epigaea]